MPTYNFIDLTGKRFGRLIALEKTPNSKGKTMWKCICDCGRIVIARGEHIRNGATKSCGCYSKETHTKHGKSRTPVYKVWQKMKDRCYNKNNPAYKNYGARGIYVCARWRKSFESFFKDMGHPSKKLTIDRIDNDGPYRKNNCKWSTRMEQVTNRRNNHMVTIGNKTQCLKHWCNELNTPYQTALVKFKKGKPFCDFF